MKQNEIEFIKVCLARTRTGLNPRGHNHSPFVRSQATPWFGHGRGENLNLEAPPPAEWSTNTSDVYESAIGRSSCSRGYSLPTSGEQKMKSVKN